MTDACLPVPPSPVTHSPNSSTDTLHSGFLSILPRIELHATVYFRHLKCPGKKDDAVAETVAVAWKWYTRAIQQGKAPSEFVCTLATYAARHVRCGRKLCGQEKGKDALSTVAQRRHGFITRTWPDCDTGTEDNLVLNALKDNTETPPPDQAAFRCDFPAWMKSLNEKKRQVAFELMIGERTQEVAKKHGLTQGRISQIRSELKDGWDIFCA